MDEKERKRLGASGHIALHMHESGASGMRKHFTPPPVNPTIANNRALGEGRDFAHMNNEQTVKRPTTYTPSQNILEFAETRQAHSKILR